LLEALLTSSLTLMRIIPLIIFYVKSALLASTERAKVRAGGCRKGSGALLGRLQGAGKQIAATRLLVCSAAGWAAWGRAPSWRATGGFQLGCFLPPPHCSAIACALQH
jgi:hypothetical protein